tara:strand:+ start:6016 stop:8220 length:2205 start_codon:yes stop_codon:yes gene_type:complete
MKYIKTIMILGVFFAFPNINSQDNSNEIEEVVTVSSKQPVPIDEVVGSVAVISQDEIESRLVSDVSQLLENTIGITVPKDISSGRSRNSDVVVRGVGNNRVNIFIDGFRTGDAYQSGGYGKDLVDTELLKRVEILKGPSSSLYGSDGLAGTIAYTTKDASDVADESNPYLSATLSSQDVNSQEKVTVLGAMVRNNIEALVQLSSREMNEMEVHDDASETLNPMEGDQDSILAKLKLSLNNDSSINITFDNQELDSEYNLLTDLGSGFSASNMQVENVSSSLGLDNLKRERFSITYEFSGKNSLFDSGVIRSFSQKTDQRTTTSKNKAIMVMPAFGPPIPSFVPTSEVSDYDFNQEVSGFSVEMIKVIGNHNIVYGIESETAEYSRNNDKTEVNLITGDVNKTLANTLYPHKRFPDSEVTREAVFINDRIYLNDVTTAVLGARYDSYDQKAKTDALHARNNIFGHEVNPRSDSQVSMKVGLIRDISGDMSLFLQYAEGYRNPNFDEAYNTYTNLAQMYTIIPNPDITAETSEGFEIGLRGSLSNTSWSLAYYKNDYKDFIAYEYLFPPIQGVLQVQYQNLGSVETNGVEFESKTVFNDNFSASFGLSLNEGKEDDGYLDSLSPDHAKISLSWISDSGRLRWNTNSTLMKSSRSTLSPVCGRSGICSPAQETAGRVTLDTYLNFDITKKVNIKFGVRNLTDVKYWDYPTVAGQAEGTADEYLMPGRNMSFSIKYTL